MRARKLASQNTFTRCPLDVVERHSVAFRLQFPIVIKAESIKFVEPSHIGKHVVTMVLDLLPDRLAFSSPRQLGRSQTLAGELVNLISRRACLTGSIFSDQCEVKREEARDQGLD